MGNRKKWVTSGQNLIDCRDAEEDFRDEGLSQGEQFGDAADNLRLINDAEKVFEEEHCAALLIRNFSLGRKIAEEKQNYLGKNTI